VGQLNRVRRRRNSARRFFWADALKSISAGHFYQQFSFKMVAPTAWLFLTLSCVRAITAQSTLYQLTTSVSNPAPVPGQPFTITWTGGEVNEAVYIVLNNYFPDLPNQDIIYGGMDILCSFSPLLLSGSWLTNMLQQMRQITGPGSTTFP
jgi:hypothetical protein